MPMLGHNSHGPQPRHPKQAYNKLKCYELTIINGRQSKPSHTFYAGYLRPQHTQHRR
jgi:hypothetical protein